jgi:hypothetical protein
LLLQRPFVEKGQRNSALMALVRTSSSAATVPTY